MRSIFFSLLTLFMFIPIHGQVAINKNEAQGALDIEANIPGKNYQSGLVLPVVSDIEKVKTPKGEDVVKGTIVFDESENCLRYRKVDGWTSCIRAKLL